MTEMPAYRRTHAAGELDEKIEASRRALTSCTLCPRQCGVDRAAGETGWCQTADRAVVASYAPHFGEERPLVGTSGSGTIFFARCNLLCLFCQNYEISHGGEGRPVSAGDLAEMMLQLQSQGCHNINFVTPTHVVPQILAALPAAIDGGLRVPLVYNTGGYDRVETLKLLDGVIDIYMPDFKFWDPELARDACDAPDYPEAARESLREMFRQVGDLTTDSAGIARRGLLVRHLVLPGGRAGTESIMRFIADEISTATYVNIMPQYRPCGRAAEVSGLDGYPSRTDFQDALDAARAAGLTRLDPPRRVFMLA